MIRHAPKMMKEHRRHLRLERSRKEPSRGNSNLPLETYQLCRDIVTLMRDRGMRNERELFRMRIENMDWTMRGILLF